MFENPGGGHGPPAPRYQRPWLGLAVTYEGRGVIVILLIIKKLFSYFDDDLSV